MEFLIRDLLLLAIAVGFGWWLALEAIGAKAHADGQPPQRPIQFGLRSLFVAMAGLAFFLTQPYMATAAAGSVWLGASWLRKPRSLLASAVVVFVWATAILFAVAGAILHISPLPAGQ